MYVTAGNLILAGIAIFLWFFDAVWCAGRYWAQFATFGRPWLLWGAFFYSLSATVSSIRLPGCWKALLMTAAISLNWGLVLYGFVIHDYFCPLCITLLTAATLLHVPNLVLFDEEPENIFDKNYNLNIGLILFSLSAVFLLHPILNPLNLSSTVAF